ncbi:MAG: carboxypeptidase regulatory-like domain-containing protein [Chloroflexi bacterium]|nr:carboxypeptidase regulatory-like domain-containing protein [Chloroflexota bacterium]
MKRQIWWTAALVWLLAGTATAAAHGAKIEYSLDTVIQIQARYDSGEPMGGGQVVVYAPNDPATPWLTGVADENGRFTFTPDPALPGTWDVQVRQAGHGDIIHIPVGGGSQAAAAGYTTPQIILMSASVVWGMVGTALYFSRRPAHAHS